MLRSTATIHTPRADRYRDQLARHGAGMLRQARNRNNAHRAEFPPIREAKTTGESLVLDLGWGRCTVIATPDALILEAEAATRDDLARIQDGVGRRVRGIGRRDGLVVTWSPADGEPGGGEVDVETGRRSRPLAAIALATALVVVIMIHLGIGAALLRQAWTWWALVGLGIVVVLKLFMARHFAGAMRRHGFHRPWRTKRVGTGPSRMN